MRASSSSVGRRVVRLRGYIRNEGGGLERRSRRGERWGAANDGGRDYIDFGGPSVAIVRASRSWVILRGRVDGPPIAAALVIPSQRLPPRTPSTANCPGGSGQQPNWAWAHASTASPSGVLYGGVLDVVVDASKGRIDGHPTTDPRACCYWHSRRRLESRARGGTEKLSMPRRPIRT